MHLIFDHQEPLVATVKILWLLFEQNTFSFIIVTFKQRKWNLIMVAFQAKAPGISSWLLDEQKHLEFNCGYLFKQKHLELHGH